MTAPKTFGQIAWEANYPQAEKFGTWNSATESEKARHERIGAAIALECSRICTELAAGHMRQAPQQPPFGGADCRQQAAIECSQAILEAISCSSKEAT